MRFTLLLAFLCGASLLLNVECLHPEWDVAGQWLVTFNQAIESREKKYIRGMVAGTGRVRVCGGTWEREKIVDHLAELPKGAKYSIELLQANSAEKWKETIYMVVYINGLFNLEDKAELHFDIKEHGDGNWELLHVYPTLRAPTICKSSQKFFIF